MMRAIETEKLAHVALIVQVCALVWGIVAAVTSNSLALLADALGALLDVASLGLAYASLRLQRGSYRFLLDYGIGKLETLATLAIGVLTGVAAIGIIYRAGEVLLMPQRIAGPGIRLGIAGCMIMAVCCGGLWWRFRQQSARQRTPIVVTQVHVQAIGFWTALGVSVPLVCALFSEAPWVRYLDIAVSLAIGVFTARLGWKMVRHSLPDALDQSLSEPLQAIINRHLVGHFDKYAMFEGLRSRASGTDTFIEIVLSFDPSTPIGDIQTVADSIKASIEQDIQGSHVTVVATALQS